MRYTYACFKGYIGFYNGLGMDKVEIDFTKCKSNIILITGINGCGKSTLMNALNPFPDSSSSFTPGKDGEKLLTLVNGSDIYNIKIVSPYDIKGGRKQTKAFISKNGIEMNENGNVTSYKEIIFSEFDLDPNYISLTKLSSNDRGLGDKTPAERKKFVSNIIDNVEIYNDIYKTLNKKSLVFKSHINTLHTKIQNIGSKENLEMTLSSLQQKYSIISDNLLSLNNKIVELETRASINQEEAQQMEELISKRKEIEDKLSYVSSQILLLQKSTKIKPEEILSKFESDKKLYDEYVSRLERLNMDWMSESKRLSELMNSVNEMKANIEMYSSGIDDTLEKKYEDSKRKIDGISKELCNLGIGTDVNLIPNITELLSLYSRFIRKIDLFYDGLSSKGLKMATINYDPNRIQMIKLAISNNDEKISNLLVENGVLKAKLDKLSILKSRPKKCSIDTCPFIAEAVDIGEKSGPTILSKISENEKEIENIQQENILLNNQLEECAVIDKKRIELMSIIDELNQSSDLLRLFNEVNLLDNNFMVAVSNNSQFNEYREPRRYIDGSNLLKELATEQSILSILEVEYNSYKDKIQLISSTNNSILKMEEDIEKTSTNVNSLRLEKESYNELCNTIKNNLNNESQYVELYNQSNSLNKDLESINSLIKTIEDKSSDSMRSITRINEIRMQIDELTKESAPISSEIQKISGQLTLLNSYYNEYETYKEKFDMIETLKKYCSPTGGGIQTIFMQLYMSKTLDLANQVLSMLFNGEYQLLDFIINQNEFRIPFIGNGLAVDDISSGSTSQICIMGMAINLVLSHQASTKFNIARLDEVDSGLDHRNRFGFVNVLFNTLPILEIEQLFAISHSIEADTSMVDIIKLKSYSDFEESVHLGNVIYDYSEEFNKTLN